MTPAGGIAGGVALGLMAFISGTVPPLPGPMSRWIGSIGPQGVVIGLALYGLFGFFCGLVLGHVAERCFRRSNAEAGTDQLNLTLVFLLAVVACLIFFNVD
jgi:hypothetical protein